MTTGFLPAVNPSSYILTSPSTGLSAAILVFLDSDLSKCQDQNNFAVFFSSHASLLYYVNYGLDIILTELKLLQFN